MINKIINNQKKILLEFKKSYKKKIYLNSFNYCSIGAQTLGAIYFKLTLEFRKNIIKFIKVYFTEIYSLGLIKRISILNNFKNKKFEILILNWAFKKDFKNYFFDKNFNIRSNKFDNILWVLLYLSNDLPKKIPKNALIIHIKKNKSFNFINFLSNFLMILKKKNFFIFKNLSQQVFLSISINNLIKKKIKIFDSKKMYITYESQLFQKNIIYELKKNYKRLKIIGYDHTAPQPLPINLFHDKYSPDFLIVNSKNKFDFNHKYLGWPKKKMKIMKSFRFRIIKKDFQLKIFLPYVLNDQEAYIIKIINLMKILKIKDLKSFKIKIHPACKKKIKHLNFIKKLKKLKNLEFKNNKNNNKNKNNNIVVFLGQTTAIPIAIESKLDCYNICLDPNFDLYNPKIWSGIKCNEIDNNIYLYKLKKKKSLIWIDNKYNDFNKLEI